MENIDEINKKRAGLSRPLAHRTKIPKFRAVPLEARGAKSEQRNNQWRDIKNVLPQTSSNGTANKIVRRQWQSFDLGTHLSKQEELSWSHELLHEDSDHDMGDAVRASDLNFERLKEDLAADGTPEGLLKMARDMMQDTDGSSTDEVKYRDEQAVFWLMKSSERGSDEAMSVLKDMVKAGRGITESNKLEVRTYLSMSKKELVGQRIGRRLFHCLSNGRGFIPLVHLLEISRSGLLLPLQQGRYRDSETVLATRRSEKITLSKCVEAGLAHAYGDVPEVDARLADREDLSLMTWEGALLAIANTVRMVQMFILGLMSTVTVQLVFLLTLYHLLLNRQLTVALDICCRVSLIIAIPLCTAQVWEGRLVLPMRHRRWCKIFSKALDSSEKSTVKRAFESQSTRMELQHLVTVTSVVLVSLPAINWPIQLEVIAFLLVLLIRDRFWRIHLFTSALLFVSHNCDVQEAAQKWLLPQLSILDIVTAFKDVNVMYRIPTTAIFLLPLLLTKYGLSRSSHIWSKSSLLVLVIELLIHGQVSEETINMLYASLGIGLLLCIFKDISGRRRKRKAAKVIMMVAISLTALAVHHQLLPSPRAPPSSLTWQELRRLCPKNSSPEVQRTCSNGLMGLSVSWEGKVEEVELLWSAPQPWQPHLNTALEYLGLQAVDICGETSSNSMLEDAICQLRKPLGLSLRRPAALDSCRFKIRMTSTLFHTSDDLLTVDTTQRSWNNCSQIVYGDSVAFVGAISMLFDHVVINANELYKKI